MKEEVKIEEENKFVFVKTAEVESIVVSTNGYRNVSEKK